MSYFGNPAMKFKRLSSQAGKVNQGPEPASCLARFWHHFSTSILDVFLYRGVQGMVTAAAFVTSRVLVPDITGVGQAFEVLGIYIAFALGSWYVFSVLLGNLLFNGSAPRSNVSLPSYKGFDIPDSPGLGLECLELRPTTPRP